MPKRTGSPNSYTPAREDNNTTYNMSKQFYHRAQQQYQPPSSGSSYQDPNDQYAYPESFEDNHIHGQNQGTFQGYSHDAGHFSNGIHAPSYNYHYFNGGRYSSSMPDLPIGASKSHRFADVDPNIDAHPAAASKVSPNDSFQASYDHQDQDPNYRKSSYFSEAPALDAYSSLSTSGSSESSTTSTNAQRPLPAKSAFMCFSEARREGITLKLGAKSKNGIVKAVAKEWRDLPNSEKKYWENMATVDKTRYAREKEAYKGPLGKNLRAKKNPLAPKRPMSAFLMYAQKMRRVLQDQNPAMPNADISRLLGETWRNADLEEKQPFLDREEGERKIYRAKMDSWKNDQKLAKLFKSPVERERNHKREKDVDQREDTESSFPQRGYGECISGHESVELTRCTVAMH